MSESISAVVEYSEVQPASENESMSAVVEAPPSKIPTKLEITITPL